MSENHGAPDLESLLEYLKNTRGLDLTSYKRSSLTRRIHRRMQEVGIEDFEGYQDYLEVHPDEFEFLFNTILINVTAFFRDQDAWEFLREEVVPRIVEGKRRGEPLRAWSAGCASGEEAYSLAIMLAEALGIEECRQRVKIYATDIDAAALDAARQATYSAAAVKAVPKELRDRYFELSSGRYVFRNDLRRMVIFGRHDLLQDAPISRLDLLVCRNTLIYFNRDAQKRIIARFHFALSDTGYLFLGKAEMLLGHMHLFEPEHIKCRVFSKIPSQQPRDRMMVLAQAGDLDAVDQLGSYMRLREAAFNIEPVAHVVVDREGNLALANGRARALFELLPQDIGRPFQDLRLSYQPIELRSLMERARVDRRPVRAEDVEYRPGGTDNGRLDVEVAILEEDGGRFLGTSIAFLDVSQHSRLRTELQYSREEAETPHEELQATNEELETSNEELQSTVEELQTTNEELQSTNEEMETMNEELQSTNEELQTMNLEMNERTVELNQANAFLQSILSCVDVGIVVIDTYFHIQLWNNRAEDMWGLRAGEVVGRSLLSLDIGLPVAELREPIRRFMAGDDDCGDLELQARNRRGRAIACAISCTVQYDIYGNSQGVVLLMEEREP
jgi:two-component system CheB/CheR fusion protein